MSKKDWQEFKKEYEAKHGKIHLYDVILGLMDIAVCICLIVKLAAIFGWLFGLCAYVFFQVILAVCCIVKCKDMIISNIATKSDVEITKMVSDETSYIQTTIKALVLLGLHIFA